MNGTFTSEPVPFLWNLSESGARFRAAAPNHPEALLEEPQAFEAVGEQRKSLEKQWRSKERQAKTMEDKSIGKAMKQKQKKRQKQ